MNKFVGKMLELGAELDKAVSSIEISMVINDAEILYKNHIEQLNIPIFSQRSKPLPLFDDRHLNNGIAFTLTESGKLGNHPESKLVYETTGKLKKWILDNFELKKR